MRPISLLILFLTIANYTNAQQDADAMKRKMRDSVMAARIDEAALMYPRIRQFSITHQETMSSNISSKLYGKDFFKSDFRASRTTINMSAPILSRNKNTVIGSLGVVHQFFGLRNVTNYGSDHTVTDMTTYIPMINLGASYIRQDSLFGRPVTFTASVNALVNPSFSSRQFTFMGLVSVPIIRTENTNLMGGVVVMVDPSSPAPAFIFVSYFHRFRSLGLELMADLPYRIALRKPMLNRASLSAFSEMAGSNSFFEFQNPNPNLPAKMTYSSLEIKSGLLFEYRVTKKAVLSISGGLNSTVKSRILEQGAKPNDYFIKNKNSAAPYVQVGFSLLPFWSPFKSMHKW